jgi:hypothetical protein
LWKYVVIASNMVTLNFVGHLGKWLISQSNLYRNFSISASKCGKMSPKHYAQRWNKHFLCMKITWKELGAITTWSESMGRDLFLDSSHSHRKMEPKQRLGLIFSI